MPRFRVDLLCQSCDHEEQRVMEVENTSGPEDDDANADGAPECSSCGDVDWTVLAYEEVEDAPSSPPA